VNRGFGRGGRGGVGGWFYDIAGSHTKEWVAAQGVVGVLRKGGGD